MNGQGKLGICLVEDYAIMGEALNQFFQLEDLTWDWFRSLASARTALRGGQYCALISEGAEIGKTAYWLVCRYRPSRCRYRRFRF